MASTATFEAGTLAATIAAADAGSATAWDAVSIDATAAAIYDNAQKYGALAAKFSSGGTSGASFCQWTTNYVDQSGTHFGRFYVYATANPAANMILVNVQDDIPNTSHRVLLTSAGKISVTDKTGVAVITTAASITLNQWVRVEWKAVQSVTVGQVEAQLFNSPDSATPTETITSAANLDILVTAKRAMLGHVSNSTNYAFWMDNLVVGDTAYPGPVATAPAWDKRVSAMYVTDPNMMTPIGVRMYAGAGAPPAEWTIGPSIEVREHPHILTAF